FNADGDYVLTSVQHTARNPSHISGGGGVFSYHNSFTCIPSKLPYRPARTTAKPFVQGTQTAEVVGPSGQEIFTDKYGRVKVQFHWDRQGKHDADSSCWVRVAQVWAGKRWGASFWPRIGQEVVVAFHEGDPGRPIIIGSVYNAEQMPPYQGSGPDGKHASDNKVSGFKSNTTLGGSGFNELRFDDTKDAQQVFIHAERNMDTRVKKDSLENVVENKHLIVGKDQKEKIKGNVEHLVVGDQDAVTQGTSKELIEGDSHEHVKGAHNEKVDGKTSLT